MTGANGKKHAPAKTILRRAAFFHLVRLQAEEMGEYETAEYLKKFDFPALLTAHPFGKPISTPTDMMPVSITPAGNKKLLLNPSTADVNPVSYVLNNLNQKAGVVPVSDGSFIVGAEGSILRLSSETSEVLGRIIIGSARVIFMWPDPCDRTRLKALLPSNYSEEDAFEVMIANNIIMPSIFRPAHTVLITMDQFGVQDFRIKVGNEIRKKLEAQKITGNKEEKMHALVLERFFTETKRDPNNPFLWLLILKTLKPDCNEELRTNVLNNIVQSANAFLPRSKVWIGVELERAGFRKEADMLYDRAAEQYFALGGNPDFNTNFFTSPSSFIRMLSRDHYKDGRIERALQLIEIGRQFSTCIEGDHQFYQAYELWLKKQKRFVEAEEIRARVSESRITGNYIMVSPTIIFGVDVAVILWYFSFFYMALVVFIFWYKARPTVIADLSLRGMNTFFSRLTGFLKYPIDRFSRMFLHYTPRSGRLLVVIITSICLGISILIIGAFSIGPGIEKMYSSFLWYGYPGYDWIIKELEERVKTGKTNLATLHILAEGYRTRGDRQALVEIMTTILKQHPNDPLALNNQAVLDEEANKREDAEKKYKRALDASPEKAAVARYNLSRLKNQKQELQKLVDKLAHRDKARLKSLGTDKPLWANSSSNDLLNIFFEVRSLYPIYIEAIKIFTTGTIAKRVGIKSKTRSFIITLFMYGISLFILITFIWLPFTPKPYLSAHSTLRREKKTSLRLRLPQGLVTLFRKVKTVSVPVITLLVPGMYDMLRGQLIRGIFVQLNVLFWATIYFVIWKGGILHNLFAFSWTNFFKDFSPPLAYTELSWLSHIALVILISLLILTIPITLYKRQKEGS